MFQDFSRIVLGQCVPDDHSFGCLERGDATRLEKGTQFAHVGSRGSISDDDRAGLLTGPRVGQAHNGDLGDGRMADEDVLDLLRRDVLTIADNDVLDTAGHDQIIAVDPVPEIARPEKALGVEGVGVVFGMQVTEKHLWAPGTDLPGADLIGAMRPGRMIDDLDRGNSGPTVGVGGVVDVGWILHADGGHRNLC